MRIYRDHGFAILENIAAYSVNQLHVEQIGNVIRIAQLGSNRGELRVNYTTIKDGFGNLAGETPEDVFEYVSSIIYGDSTSVTNLSKHVNITLNPPASNQYTVTFPDTDAVVGDVYVFTPEENDGELQWNAIVAYGCCKTDGTIEVNIQAPTGLIVGNYSFKYKVA